MTSALSKSFSPSFVAYKEPLCDNYAAKAHSPLPPDIEQRIKGKSWKEDCPIPLSDLAYVELTHYDLKGKVCFGELLCHKNLIQEFIEIFRKLFDVKYPIEKMRLIDDYDANDEASMEDNNSSAFCSRAITGTVGKFSKHSYGGTIDINPKFNPYVKGKIVLPKNATPYLDRTLNIPEMIKEGDSCYTAFIDAGFQWGGHWQTLKDYQHFEKDPSSFCSIFNHFTT